MCTLVYTMCTLVYMMCTLVYMIRRYEPKLTETLSLYKADLIALFFSVTIFSIYIYAPL